MEVGKKETWNDRKYEDELTELMKSIGMKKIAELILVELMAIKCVNTVIRSEENDKKNRENARNLTTELKIKQTEGMRPKCKNMFDMTWQR